MPYDLRESGHLRIAVRTRCIVLSVFVQWFTSTLGRWASSSTTHASLHDGAHLIFFCTVRQQLNHTLVGQWIEHEGPVKWSALSPDFNPLDFWMCRHLMTLVYSELISESVVRSNE